MDLAPFHLWIVWIHVVGVFLVLLGHGISAGVMWRLRTERDPVAVRTLLDFSRRSMTLMGIGALMWLVFGITAGFSGNYWASGSYWIWVSLAIAIATIILMTPFGRIYLNRVRGAVGVDPKTGTIDSAAVVDPVALDAAIMTGRPMLVAAIGVGTVVVLSWLMYFKPF
jgi:hypothetical protein